MGSCNGLNIVIINIILYILQISLSLNESYLWIQRGQKSPDHGEEALCLGAETTWQMFHVTKIAPEKISCFSCAYSLFDPSAIVIIRYNGPQEN